MGSRVRVLAIILLLCFAGVLIQLVNIQVVQQEKLAANPNNPIVKQARLDKSRGQILASDGTVLARSVLNPKAKRGEYRYRREYPEGALFGHLVGFDSPIYGRWGIEESYNRYLISHKQPALSLAELLNPSQSTNSVQLTIVPALQRVAQAQLKGRSGAIVALDPTTGAILAMYSNPAFDPNPLVAPSAKVEREAWTAYNLRDGDGFAPLNGMAYQRTFAPGSTFKTITSAAALEYNPGVAAKSYPPMSSTPLPQSDKTLSNFGGSTCGGSLAQMLPPSCDTGYALMGLDLGGNTMSMAAKAFGYEKIPPLDIPGAAASAFPSAETLQTNKPALAYSAIGQQDVTTTALLNALTAAAFANRGAIMTPHLMMQVRDQQGRLVSAYEPHLWKQATTPSVASQISVLMQQVVTQGTATGVGFLPQDDVAAKTGTAQTGNATADTHNWMILFAPASNPVVAIAVVMPFQPTSGTGAEVAGPIARCMVEAALAIHNRLPPTGTATTCPS